MTYRLALLADHRCPVGDQVVSNIAEMVKYNRTARPAHFNAHPTYGTRTKDLTRLMWILTCITNKQTVERDEIADILIQQVDELWSNGQFRIGTDYHLLSDFFLSLAFWRLYPQSLIESIISQEYVYAAIRSSDSFRRSRLALFLKAASIEAPHLKLDESFLVQLARIVPPFFVMQEINRRPYLAILADTIRRKQKKNSLGWENIEIFSTVPHLNLGGVTFIHKE